MASPGVLEWCGCSTAQDQHCAVVAVPQILITFLCFREDIAASKARFSLNSGSSELQRLNKILGQYVGTHNFHNFTVSAAAGGHVAADFCCCWSELQWLLISRMASIGQLEHGEAMCALCPQQQSSLSYCASDSTRPPCCKHKPSSKEDKSCTTEVHTVSHCRPD